MTNVRLLLVYLIDSIVILLKLLLSIIVVFQIQTNVTQVSEKDLHRDRVGFCKHD